LDWLHRIRRAQPRDSEPVESQEELEASMERATPGVAALLAGLSEDGSHAVLDLGPAVDSHLRLFSGFARQIRFASLLPYPPRGEGWAAALGTLPPHPHNPYDLVLVWDLLDRLALEERPPLIERLAQLTAPGARLYAVVDTSDGPTVRPLRFTLRGLDRVSQRSVGPPEPAVRQLLPAQVERLLAPFEVVHAFILRQGLREYVAVKGG
jgi:hypothetical protein